METNETIRRAEIDDELEELRFAVRQLTKRVTKLEKWAALHVKQVERTVRLCAERIQSADPARDPIEVTFPFGDGESP